MLPLLLAIGLAPSVAVPARAAWMLPPAPFRAKDFCIVKARNGLYHVFYIRNNVTLPASDTEREFGHAMTPNFWTWTQLPPVLSVRDSAWDNTHVWAPSIVEQDSVYYMFYTGVTDVAGSTKLFQRIGVATSTDLMNWNRMDAPTFSCVDVPWAYCDSTDAKCAFRDPFVMPDPAQPGGWLMCYSASAPADSSMLVGIAQSSGDLTQWHDLMPLWNTYRPMTGGYIAESPHMFELNGLWYLFYTTVQAQPLQFQTSEAPAADAFGWTMRGSLGGMLGLNTAAWYASEHFQDGLIHMFAFVEFDRLTFYRMIAAPGDWHFALQQPDRFRILRMGWTADTTRVGSSATLYLKGIESIGKFATLETAVLQPDGTERPIPPDSLGLPSIVSMTSDSTLVNWHTFLPPDSTDTTRVVRLVVRTQDQTTTARTLIVLRDTLAVIDTLPPPPNPDPPTAPDPNEGGSDEPPIRPLRYAPFGLPSVLVQMTEEAHARVDVFDLQGRRLRTLADRVLARGAHVLAWDGRGGDGSRVGAGVYFVRLTTPRVQATARLVLLP